MQQCAERFNRSKSTIHNLIKRAKENDENFINELEQIKNKQTQDILDVLKNDTRLSEIADKILTIMNDPEVLQNELERKGLQPLTNALGMLLDKALKLKQLNDTPDDRDILTTDDGFDKAINEALNNLNAKSLLEKVSTDV